MFKEGGYKGTYTWEVALHYGQVLALARAVQASGTATDVRAIRKAFPKAYPLLGDQVPAMVFGLTSDGRQKMLCSTQAVDKDGKLGKPVLEVFWPKTQRNSRRLKSKLILILNLPLWYGIKQRTIKTKSNIGHS